MATEIELVRYNWMEGYIVKVQFRHLWHFSPPTCDIHQTIQQEVVCLQHLATTLMLLQLHQQLVVVVVDRIKQAPCEIRGRETALADETVAFILVFLERAVWLVE